MLHIRGRRALFTLIVLSSTTALFGACGGAIQSDLFSGAADASVSPGPETGKTGGSVVDARTDGSPTLDGATDGLPHDAPPVDASPPPVIVCNAANCAVGTQTCCAEHKNGSIRGECKDLNKCTGTGKFGISCDGDDDCQVIKKDSVCCVTFSLQTGQATGASCAEVKDCTNNTTRTRTCDPTAKNICDTGDVCRLSTNTLPGYYLCLPPI